MSSLYKRKGIWYIDLYLNHKRVRKPAGKCKKLAEEALRKIEAEALQGNYNLPVKKPELLFDSLIADYLELVSRVKKSYITGEKRDKGIFNNFQKVFPEIKYLSQIDLRTGQIYISKRKLAGVKNSTVNREIATIKAFFNYCMDLDYIEKNPWQKLKKMPQPKEQKVFLEVDEAKKLLEAAKTVTKETYIVTAIAIFAGLRRGEITALKWVDVDYLHRKQLTIRCDDENRTKSNKYRIVDIDEQLIAILKQHRIESEFRSPYVVSNKDGSRLIDPKKGFASAVAKSGIKKHVTLKTLRTTACSFWASSGVPLKQAQLWLGHSDIELTSEIYSHIVPSLQSKYLNSISNLFKEKQNSEINPLPEVI